MTVSRPRWLLTTKKILQQFHDVTRLKYLWPIYRPRRIVENRRNVSGSRDADLNRNRCLAAAGERRRSHAHFARARGFDARRRSRIPGAGRFSVGAAADLSGSAHRAAKPQRDRATD